MIAMLTAEKKAMLEKICTHQLEGLMFHFDYACIAKLLGHDKMACIQHKQAMKETEKHFNTVLRLIEVYGEVIHASSRNLPLTLLKWARSRLVRNWRIKSAMR